MDVGDRRRGLLSRSLSPEAVAAAAATAAAEVEAVGLGAQARCGSYPRRSTRMEKAGVDAQGHFVTTLLVTSRGGQGQSHGRRPAGSGIKKSSQKATPGVVSITKGADIFKIFFRYCGPSLAPWTCQTQSYKLTLFALLLQTG